jgi:hypothetical protein
MAVRGTSFVLMVSMRNDDLKKEFQKWRYLLLAGKGYAA